MSIKTKLPPVIERHELKYLIPYSYVDPISKFLSIYCSLDHYSSLSSDSFYQVNSLYFDTPNLEFLQQRLFGKNGRFNVRVRCYGHGDKAPYFLEIKQKSGFSGVKYRAIANENEWPNILNDPTFRITDDCSVAEKRNKQMFSRIADSYAIEPKIFTQYQRKAFVSQVDDYARVTMDINMKYRAQDHYDLVSDDRLINYDNENIYCRQTQSKASVILELKSNIGQVPMWMLDLISTFDLKQEGFSKYVNSSLTSLIDDGIHYMSGDRMIADY